MTPPDSGDTPKAVAVEQLKSLGLSTYATRTFVALVRLGEGTAQEVSEVAEVPRTRVYDAVEELREEGLVTVVEFERPKRFRPASVAATEQRFRQKYDRRIDRLSDSLAALDDAE